MLITGVIFLLQNARRIRSGDLCTDDHTRTTIRANFCSMTTHFAAHFSLCAEIEHRGGHLNIAKISSDLPSERMTSSFPSDVMLPPVYFSTVSPGIFRSAYFKKSSYNFLQNLNLKSAV